MKKMKFDKWDCDVILSEYNNGRKAIVLNDSNDGQCVAVPTINVPDIPMLSDEVIIKTYDYPKVLDALIQAKIVHPPHREISTGYVTVPICFLVPDNPPSEKEPK